MQSNIKILSYPSNFSMAWQAPATRPQVESDSIAKRFNACRIRIGRRGALRSELL
jgi:hypothetical protein